MSTQRTQYLFLYSPLVAGKSAKFAEAVMQRLLEYPGATPFDKVRRLVESGTLLKALKNIRSGKYSTLIRGYPLIIKLNTDTCTIGDLLEIPGIGPKTARMMLMLTRENTSFAVLDVHILRWLHNLGYPNIPKNTPSGQKYSRIEKIFLEEAELREISPAELDQAIWCKGAGYQSF